MTIHMPLLHSQSRSADPAVAAVADNCRFDERAGDERWRQYDAIVSDVQGDPNAVTWADWAEAHELHLNRHYNVLSYSTPDAFLPINIDAWLEDLSENQTLVRLEAITHPLVAAAMSSDRLRDAHDRANEGDADARSVVAAFCETWNQLRDGRPMFAAFYDEVKSEVEDDDWAIALRDRLGLGHYGADGPSEVALMSYPTSYVLSRRVAAGSTACALPTVLDNGMHEFFFPAPRQHPYGATLHLVPDLADSLTAEVLHHRIDYRAEHILRLGRIDCSHRLAGQSLVDARDLHLVSLQEACDREDFGELLEERV